METKEDELVEAGKQKEDDRKAGGGRRKRTWLRWEGNMTTDLCLGRCRGRMRC